MRGLPTALLLQSVSLLAPFEGAAAQSVQNPQSQHPANAGEQQAPIADNDEDKVIITGRLPGSVVGNIPPQDVLRARDLHATGAASFDDLLAAIAPEIESSTGSMASRPVVLLNGRRISSYRELRDIPVEAIERLDIMPEEVALEYGYRPDQKVLNVVLKEHFQSTAAQVAGVAAAHERKIGGSGDFTRFELGTTQRTTLNAHIGGADELSSAQQALVPQQYDVTGTGQTGFASPPAMRARAGATISRPLRGNAQATLNAEIEHNFSHSLAGLSEQLPADLNRNTTLDALHVGAVVNGNQKQWQWSTTATGNIQHESTATSEAGTVSSFTGAQSDHSELNLDATMNGVLFNLPGGGATIALRAASGFETLHVDQESPVSTGSNSHTRTSSIAGVNLDLPISGPKSAFRALGTLAFNGNIEVDHLSDFGLLTNSGLGVNWSPVQRLSFIASWNREEDAPSLRQLGAASLETPNTPIFDFSRGTVDLAKVIVGGNSNLRTQTRNALKLSAEWQPLEDPNLRLRANYAHVRVENPISNITVSPEFEAAFPDRFARDVSGNLLSADMRPVNLKSAHRDTLQVGFDFSRALKSRRPTQQQVAQIIEKARAAGIEMPQVPSEPANGAPPSLAQQFSNTGRITFSLTDTITLADRAILRSDLPELDYLGGAAVGQTGGEPVHQVQAQVGYFKNGMGARLGLNWRSATRVDTSGVDSLHFSPLATFDLRLFANVGQDVPLVLRHPWLAGTSVRFEVRDLFDTQPRVHNAGGAIPLGYSPGMLDPFGRSIMLSIRKQFLPISYYRDQLMHFEQDQAQKPH